MTIDYLSGGGDPEFELDYLDEIMSRIVATEKEQLSGVVRFNPNDKPIKLDAMPFFIWQQEAFPYITHRLGEELPRDQGNDLQERPYTIVARFVAAHVGAGIKGENERMIYRFEPLIVSLFTNNPYLLSEAYPEAMPQLDPDGVTFRRSTGTRAFDNRGISLPSQIGFEFTIDPKFMLDIRRRW